jgi:hypothetical protein
MTRKQKDPGVGAPESLGKSVRLSADPQVNTTALIHLQASRLADRFKFSSAAVAVRVAELAYGVADDGEAAR